MLLGCVLHVSDLSVFTSLDVASPYLLSLLLATGRMNWDINVF